jgi:hypothetical protein
VSASGRERERAARCHSNEAAVGVERVQQREEVVLVRPASVEEHERAFRVAGRRSNAMSELLNCHSLRNSTNGFDGMPLG